MMEPLQLLEHLEQELQAVANREHIALRQSIECGIGALARQLITNDIRSPTSAKAKCSPPSSPLRQSSTALWPTRSERSPSPMRSRQQRKAHASARVPGAHSVSPTRLSGGVITCSSPSASKQPNLLLAQGSETALLSDTVPARTVPASQEQQQLVASTGAAQQHTTAARASSDQGHLICHLMQQQGQMMHLLHSLMAQEALPNESLSPSKVRMCMYLGAPAAGVAVLCV